MRKEKLDELLLKSERFKGKIVPVNYTDKNGNTEFLDFTFVDTGTFTMGIQGDKSPNYSVCAVLQSDTGKEIRVPLIDVINYLTEVG